MMSSVRKYAGALAALAAVGCGDDAFDLAWRVVPGPGVDAGAVRLVEASIRQQGCDGDVLWAAQSAPGGRFAPGPPALEPGRWGFAARVLDASCRWIASGCAELSLPRSADAEVDVVVDMIAPEATCAPGDCVEGRCGSSDAGPGQDAGGLDAGSDDAGERDAGQDAGPCAPRTADCNEIASDGCETSLTTLADCGDCDTPCALPHAGESCESATCQVDGCDPGWDDCNGEPADGCEAQLDTIAHCARCFDACFVAGASSECQDGDCVVTGCAADRIDCDGNLDNGCDNLLESELHCGGCDQPCVGGEECHKGVCGEE